MNQEIETRLKNLSENCGVYLMKDRHNQVIYIGKAKNLKNRVRSYFSGSDGRDSVPFIVANVVKIETSITSDERQALILEIDLIKKFTPKYNIKLKDGKSYLTIRIDKNAEWPRLELVRSPKEDGSTYIGPFAFGYEVRKLLDLIKNTFPLRSCNDFMLRNRVRPCLEFQIKRCAAPCCLNVDREKYLEWVEQAISVLKGENATVRLKLLQEMEFASQDLRFEEAMELRDKIAVFEKIGKADKIVNVGILSQDAVGFYREGSSVQITLLIVRGGRLYESKSFPFEDCELPTDEIIGSFLSQYYPQQLDLPEEILLPFEIEDKDIRSSYLSDISKNKVEFKSPKIGLKAKLLDLANTNAKENFIANFAKNIRNEKILITVQETFNLSQTPRVIDCIDISHHQGDTTLACVISFVDGLPLKSRYRIMRLAVEGKPDDFAGMLEAITRHLNNCFEEGSLPDLLVVDGGKQQLNKALEARAAVGLKQPEIISLAKKRSEILPLGGGRAIRAEKFERIFMENTELPVIPNPNSDLTHFLERIRDEAHRFAINSHRKARIKKVIRSKLLNIPGIGVERAKDLLKKFGSLNGLRTASVEEISLKCHIANSLAKKVKDYLTNVSED